MIWMKTVKLICVVCLSFLVLGCATKPSGPPCNVNACPVGCKLSTDTCGAGDRCCAVRSVGSPCLTCTP